MNAPELILYNGKITTLDGVHPDVSAVAIAGGRITATGGQELLGTANATTKRIDLKGRRVIPVGAGSDATRVSSYNPWLSLYWLVAGKTVGGAPLYSEANRLSREEALQLYTQGSSWFSGESGKKGAIAIGQLADVTVLTEDYFSVPEERIKGIESLLTIVDGKIVYSAGEFQNLGPAPLPVLPEWSPVKVYGGYGAPLDFRKAARADIPVPQHQHPAERHSHGFIHTLHQLMSGSRTAAPRYSDFWGLGCDCFAF